MEKKKMFKTVKIEKGMLKKFVEKIGTSEAKLSVQLIDYQGSLLREWIDAENHEAEILTWLNVGATVTVTKRREPDYGYPIYRLGANVFPQVWIF